MRKYACSADIEKVFLMVGLHESDRGACRFFWIADPLQQRCSFLQKLHPFYSLQQPHHITVSHPSTCDNNSTRVREGCDRHKIEEKIDALNSIIYSWWDLNSFHTFTCCRGASTVIPLLPKAAFAPSIQPNLGLLRTRAPPTSATNALLAIRYSSILSACSIHLNTMIHVTRQLRFYFSSSMHPLPS